VLDLLYTPKETRLLREARSAGAVNVMNGDMMLLHQAAAAFSLWTGKTIDPASLQDHLDAARDGASGAASGESVAERAGAAAAEG
jgi:shikimate dehydrogenase